MAKHANTGNLHIGTGAPCLATPCHALSRKQPKGMLHWISSRKDASAAGRTQGSERLDARRLPMPKEVRVASASKDDARLAADERARHAIAAAAGNAAPQHASGTSDTSDGHDTIRIVIRDAKPPIPARVLQAFTRTICALLLVCVAIIGVPRLFNIYEFNVLTGSMTPTYPPGTLVFVQEKDPAAIRPGEVVSYIMDEDLNIVTHRVVSNNYDDKTVTTRGDANVSDDGPILYQNIVGVVGFAIPYVGGVVDYLVNNEQGRIFGIGMLVCVLAITFLAEGICSALTKSAAQVVTAPNDPVRSRPSVKMEAVRNTRKLRRELAGGKRGKHERENEDGKEVPARKRR